MKDYYYVGIDPGKTGAFCILDKEETILHAGAFTSFSDFKDFLWIKPEDEVIASLEKVNAMPRQGVVSMWTFAENYGGWLATLELLKVKYQLVTPNKWQKTMLDTKPVGKPKVKGETKEEEKARLNFNRKVRKQAIVKCALRRLPQLNDFIKKTKDYDIADAALLALYAKLYF